MRGLGVGKPLAIIAYLAVRRQATRDELIELLWGGVTEDRARNAFRQSLHRLRAALGADALHSARDIVSLSTESGVFQVDLHRLEAALEARDAVLVNELYRGDFLTSAELGEGSFDRWLDSERMRIRDRVRAVLTSAAREAMRAGDWASAAPLAERLVAVDRFDEQAVLLTADIHLAAGQPGLALAQLNQFAARTGAELDLSPSESIREATARASKALQRAGGEKERSAHDVERPAALHGRRAELQRLMGAAQALREERGATILVTGDAGIGKSRLVDELLARESALGPLLVCRGRERPGSDTIPFAGVGEALRGLADAPGVSGASRHLLIEASRLVPALGESFSLDAAPPVADESGRLRFFEGVAAVIDAVAYEQPVALVIEDLQHASPSSLDLISYLSGRLHASPVLIILTRGAGASRAVTERTDALAPPQLAQATETRFALALAPLPDADLQLMIEDTGGGGLSGSDVDRIVRLAAGQPGRVAELVRLAKRGQLPPDVPVRLRDVLWTAFQTLTPSQRRVFFAAAMLPRAASLRLLAAAAHLPEAAAFEAALHLERRGLLKQVNDAYALAHESTSAFVVEASGMAGRALIAGWAADALAEEGSRSDAELAQLYALSGRQPLAFDHARRAAFTAAASGAWSEAERLLELAEGFAFTDGERSTIDSFRTGFGVGGRLALPSFTNGVVAGPKDSMPDADPVLDSSPDRPADTQEPPVVSTPESSRPSAGSRWRARILVPAAVALVVSAGVWALGAIDVFGTAEPALADTLVLSTRSADRGIQRFIVTNPAVGDPSLTPVSFGSGSGPTWMDSLAVPWIRATASPTGRWVSVERMTATGTDAYVISADRRDTVLIATGPGDDIPLGWAPDGRALLVSRARVLADGGLDSDLYRFDLATRRLAPLDTAADRAVTEAYWSPDGMRIAWVVRRGASRQRDVFVSRPDGLEAHVVAASDADEYQLAWSGDGTLIGFTSTRSGIPQIFAFDLSRDRLWQLTFDSVANDRLRFSPGGRYVAFESTRDGDAAVYIMPALGGTPRRITSAGAQFSLEGWRGMRARYLDRMRMVSVAPIPPGDTATLSLLALDQGGGTLAIGDVVRWRLLSGSRVAKLVPGTGGQSQMVVGLAEGTAVVEAAVPGWRADTLSIEIGTTSMQPFEDHFASPLDTDRWVLLGVPAPSVGAAPYGQVGHALYPRADLQWESGVLSHHAATLGSGFELETTVILPPTSLPVATSLSVGLTTIAVTRVDVVAPQMPLAVYAQFDGASGRVTFGAGDQRSPSIRIGAGPVVRVRISGAADGRLRFQIDGRDAWRSDLRYLGPLRSEPMRIWLGGRATQATGFGSVRWR